MKKQESVKNKTVNRFIALVALLDSPDPTSEGEMKLTKQLIDQMLTDYKFLHEYEGIYYEVVDGEITGGKHLMSEIHKAWNALISRKVGIPYGIYNNPEEVLTWILKDNWTPKERMTMVTSVMKFLHEFKDKELDGNSYEHLEAFAYSEAVCDVLRETPYVKSEILKDPSYLWTRADYFLHQILLNKIFVGDSKEEVTALRNMHSVMSLLWSHPSYALAFPPPVEEQIESSKVQTEVSAEEE